MCIKEFIETVRTIEELEDRYDICDSFGTIAIEENREYMLENFGDKIIKKIDIYTGIKDVIYYQFEI